MCLQLGKKYCNNFWKRFVWLVHIPGVTKESTPLRHYQDPGTRLSLRRWLKRCFLAVVLSFCFEDRYIFDLHYLFVFRRYVVRSWLVSSAPLRQLSRTATMIGSSRYWLTTSESHMARFHAGVGFVFYSCKYIQRSRQHYSTIGFPKKPFHFFIFVVTNLQTGIFAVFFYKKPFYFSTHSFFAVRINESLMFRKLRKDRVFSFQSV